MPNSSKLVLYASYQVGEDLPGYVRFALRHLAETGFTIVLLTNRRPLSAETNAFLTENGITLYLTENHGFDFGMWRRFLKDLAAGKGNFAPFNSIERLLLINDSIVYYQNNFADFIKRAEASSADAVSLTMNDEVVPHLQSFFLYLKQEALGAFYMHLMETPEQETFYDVVHRLEIGMAYVFNEAEVQTEALFQTLRPAMFAYPELIAQGCGFVKRKLLQHRFNTAEQMHFIRRKAYDALTADYIQLIKDAGMAADFDEAWLPKPVGGPIVRAKNVIFEKGFDALGWPLMRAAIKAKHKLQGKKPDGEEYQ